MKDEKLKIKNERWKMKDNGSQHKKDANMSFAKKMPVGIKMKD